MPFALIMRIFSGNRLTAERSVIKMNYYFYFPVKQTQDSLEMNRKYVTYGIDVFQISNDHTREIDFCSDVSLDRDYVVALAYQCTVGQLNPIHLLDVILDTLN